MEVARWEVAEARRRPPVANRLTRDSSSTATATNSGSPCGEPVTSTRRSPKAEAEAHDYAGAIEEAPSEYLGIAQAYALSDTPDQDGAEVFSLIRDNHLDGNRYLDAFFRHRARTPALHRSTVPPTCSRRAVGYGASGMPVLFRSGRPVVGPGGVASWRNRAVVSARRSPARPA